MAQWKRDHEEAMRKAESKSKEEQEAVRQQLEAQKTQMLREVQQQREQAEQAMHLLTQRQQRLDVYRRRIESDMFDPDDEGCRGYAAVRRGRIGGTVSTGVACKNCSAGKGCRWAGEGRPGHN